LLLGCTAVSPVKPAREAPRWGVTAKSISASRERTTEKPQDVEEAHLALYPVQQQAPLQRAARTIGCLESARYRRKQTAEC